MTRLASAKPAPYWTTMKRTPMGEKKRAAVQWEAAYARSLEDLLQLHRLDFWHCTVSQRSQPGFPDYAIFGDGWLAFLELKARAGKTKKAGTVSVAQERYKAAIERAGGEWRTFLLPDDWGDVDVWLNSKTGRGIWESGRRYAEVKP